MNSTDRYLDFLFSLHNRGVKFGLENTIKFLKTIGDPQDSLKCIHIAGTNGKGSTASFIASVLTEAGFKTGLYTSPHFIKFNERIRINGQIIPDKFIVKFMQKYDEVIRSSELTFFEVTTAMAFSYFNEQEVDYVVLETGLGGELDSTNVVTPLCSVITSISLEHTNILGNRIEDVTKAKAGIIKEGKPVFLGMIDEPALSMLRKKAEEKNSKCYCLKDYLNRRGGLFEFYSSDLYIDNLDTPLRGSYQKLNAALAILCLSKVMQFTDPKLFKLGLKNVIENSGIQGRWEVVYSNPTLILDSAHNLEGVKTFLNEFGQNARYSKKYLLYSSLNDKAMEEILTVSSQYFDHCYLTELRDNDRASTITDLENTAEKIGFSHSVIEDIPHFIKKFLSAGEKECLVVFGSMYLVAEVKKVFERKYYSNNV
ncbi:MAG: bifunctional folylpolyglutamate synthase/dihydrofolate synthase [Ignavibacteriales bacterium]|nr:MAG: bifunctional folylpolyglutamate synthase/dihydrofolate synthase [Ignavibacteriaceae bacterium]MBW7872388.1 bifunctional folylpolyglutamate synthase/dihydrofolate synthase [Ignavibacteria bacterium]MCZ2143607.1 bifunctional folylpolyglutamate synthase/dihydrofolate synthase [Ignavibacteriales bacterium]MBV6445464.1 Folylpolyglutamate synthase [Ignavibacteriaceae bacterium]MBZ0196770.1 bifunctional folylpolyglutamate synthase/dihydrofolate synthase [Ignavibacteriaceae bacterium]